jgi:sugar phosphate isomerase/epimerase
MYSTLNPGAIRLHATRLADTIPLAKAGGFEGVEFSVAEVADLVDQHGAAAVAAMFSDAGLRPGGWGLSIKWNGSVEEWQAGLAALPRFARAAASIGANRALSGIMPASNDREFKENWDFHVERLKPVAQILADNGCRLGLEFIAPKTLRDRFKHQFIYKPSETLEIAAEMGPNVGLLFDIWHWYTGHGVLADLQSLSNDQVVYVHINDAPAGIDVDEQQDLVRDLPGATGVLDIAGFMAALRAMNYDGPVVPEPFKASLADLPSDEERVKVVGEAVRKVMQQ